MNKIQLSFILLLATPLFAADHDVSVNSKSNLLLVHKTPTCGCCKEWVKHAKNHGFNVTTKDHQSLDKIKSKEYDGIFYTKVFGNLYTKTKFIT